MSSEDENTKLSPKKRNRDAVSLETNENADVGGHNGNEQGRNRKQPRMGQDENSNNAILLEILTRLDGIDHRLDGIDHRLDRLERKGDILEHVARPNRDPFYRNLFVQQYDEKIAKSCPTWTLMKIQKEETEYCIGITSAHLIKRIQKLTDGNELFIEIPEALYDAGVKAVLLHKDILNNHLDGVNGSAHADIMIVVLAGLPKINGITPSWDDLKPYPETTVPYKEEWLDADAIGKSRRGFVIGRRVAQVIASKSNEPKYRCTMSSGEKGDSGTLLWSITDSDKRDLIGIYMGSRTSGEHNAEGTITPALGWKELEWKDALCVPKVSVKYMYRKKGDDAYTSEELDNMSYQSGNEEKMGRCHIKLKKRNQEKFGTVIKVPTSMNYTKDKSSRSKEDEHAPYDDVCNSDVGSCSSSDHDSCYYSDVDSSSSSDHDSCCYSDVDSCSSSDHDSCYSEDEFH